MFRVNLPRIRNLEPDLARERETLERQRSIKVEGEWWKQAELKSSLRAYPSCNLLRNCHLVALRVLDCFALSA